MKTIMTQKPVAQVFTLRHRRHALLIRPNNAQLSMVAIEPDKTVVRMRDVMTTWCVHLLTVIEAVFALQLITV